MFKVDSFSMSGDKMFPGSFVTRGPRLHRGQYLTRWCFGQKVDVPFDSQVLDFAILVVQRLEDAIYGFGGGIVIMVKEIRLSNRQDLEKVVQRHVPKVWVDILELRK